jgi:MoxR-like ATPase
MEERQVSVDNNTYDLDQPFFVIATQNPIEHDGTYPLPAAQLDRFLMRLELGYPEKATEIEIIDVNLGYAKPIDTLASVVDKTDIINWQKTLSQIHVSDEIKNYCVNLSRATREVEDIKVGVSPRATVLLVRASQGSALIHGRGYVIPDDVQFIIKEVFAHRIDESGTIGESIVKDILSKVSYQ